jgi:SAM-dependent methyltransferase
VTTESPTEFGQQRPLWRRWGGRARRAVHRIATPLDRIIRWGDRRLLPPAHLRIYYYRTWDPAAFVRAGENGRTELLTRGLRPEHRVLDIGSGIGNLALGLTDYLRGSYDGLEIHPDAVAWCQQAITPRYPAFRFHRADVASRAYNPRGQTPASAYCFPFADRSFDFVLLASVFTHMLPGEVEQYLREISRVLAPGGTCIASFFLVNDETRRGVEQRTSFMSFGVRHDSGVCYLHDAAVPEAAVAYEESFVRAAHDRAGLRIRDIHRGGWWSGNADAQDVVTSELARLGDRGSLTADRGSKT